MTKNTASVTEKVTESSKLDDNAKKVGAILADLTQTEPSTEQFWNAIESAKEYAAGDNPDYVSSIINYLGNRVRNLDNLLNEERKNMISHQHQLRCVLAMASHDLPKVRLKAGPADYSHFSLYELLTAQFGSTSFLESGHDGLPQEPEPGHFPLGSGQPLQDAWKAVVRACRAYRCTLETESKAAAQKKHYEDVLLNDGKLVYKLIAADREKIEEEIVRLHDVLRESRRFDFTASGFPDPLSTHHRLESTSK